VKIRDNNPDFWVLALPTNGTVQVYGGDITLPFLRTKRTQTIQGDPGIQLKDYLSNTVTVPADTVKSGEQADFALPPALR
jgi:hypothetical protein